MGKISPLSAKYIINASIDIEGVVDKPDVIGAVFGQTEGLLGSDLELRELQRSGRIGRIEVNVDTRSGKTAGAIIIPSSLDKAETAIVGAALEIIQRIGPCNAKIKVNTIEDVRVTKRGLVIERAKELLSNLMNNTLPDSQDLADEVTHAVRVMEITIYGKDRLPAGPGVDESDEIIVVEGRADVLNLLKHGFKNAVAVNGTSMPETIIELSRRKIVTVFVDGDRGGDLIIKELMEVGDIDYVTKAPDGKEVEELSKKEVHKALRSRISVEQAGGELEKLQHAQKLEALRGERRPMPLPQEHFQRNRPPRPMMRPSPAPQLPRMEISPRPSPSLAFRKVLSDTEKKTLKEMSEDLIGTRGAYILDDKLNILGKVPITELESTVENLNSAYAVVFDGIADRDMVRTAEKANVQFLVAMDAKVRPEETKMGVITVNEL